MKPKAASSGSMAAFRQEMREEKRASKLPGQKTRRQSEEKRPWPGDSFLLSEKLSTSMLLIRPIELWKARDLIATEVLTTSAYLLVGPSMHCLPVEGEATLLGTKEVTRSCLH